LPLKKLKVPPPTGWYYTIYSWRGLANQKASYSAMHFNLARNSHKTKGKYIQTSKQANTHTNMQVKHARRQYINKYLNKYLQLWRGIISSARKYALQK